MLGGLYGVKLVPKVLMSQLLAVEGCLAAGIPLNALGHPAMKAFLQHVGVQLPDASKLRSDFMPTASLLLLPTVACVRKRDRAIFPC